MELPNDAEVGALVVKVADGLKALRGSPLTSEEVVKLYTIDGARIVLNAHATFGMDVEPLRKLYTQYLARQAFNLGRKEAFSTDGAILGALAGMREQYGKAFGMDFLKMMIEFDLPLNPNRMTREQSELGKTLTDTLIAVHKRSAQS